MSNNKNTIAVKVSNLTVSYENGVNAIKNVSFEVNEGDFLGIIGPNGGGKTTLLKAILGLIKVDSGSVEIYGKPLKESKSEIGYVPQFSSMNSSFPISVKEVVIVKYQKMHIWEVVNILRKPLKNMAKKIFKKLY